VGANGVNFGSRQYVGAVYVRETAGRLGFPSPNLAQPGEMVTFTATVTPPRRMESW
jgi:hypothetical protein